MWMMEDNNGAGYIQPSASDLSSGAITSGLPLVSPQPGSTTGQTGSNNFMNDYFKYQLLTGQTGGDASRGFFGGNLFSGSDSASTCPAPELSQNCSPPLAAGLMDWMKLAEEKEVCKAKGCCWDQKRQDMNAVGLRPVFIFPQTFRALRTSRAFRTFLTPRALRTDNLKT